MRARLIGKKNFTSQFEEASEGKTERVSAELNLRRELRDSIRQGRQG